MFLVKLKLYDHEVPIYVSPDKVSSVHEGTTGVVILWLVGRPESLRIAGPIVDVLAALTTK